MGVAYILSEIFGMLARVCLPSKKWHALVIFVLVGSITQASLPGAVSNLSASSPQVYVVAPGDTLTEIADRFGISVSTLVRLNGLRSADYLRVGQTLTLGEVETKPTGPSTSETPGSSPSASPAPSPISARTHVVMPGDTLISIAQSYGVSVEDIAAANGLYNVHFLKVEQVLLIPNSSGAMSAPSVEAQDQQVLLRIPYRTQFDGTMYEEGNCGPATLGMMMDYYGQHWSSNDLRRSVNKYLGYWALDGGSDWESLVNAAEVRGFRARGLYTGPKSYRQWTIDELVQEVEQGRPVMLLVRYRILPGHEGETWWGDHYIAFLGLTPNGDVIYHDSAFRGDSRGAYMTMSKERLLRVWGSTSVGIKNSAMSLEWLGR